MSKKYAVGIDIGGTNFRVALVNPEGEIVRKIKRPSSENLFPLIFDAISEIWTDEIVGIGVGIAGLVDGANGRVIKSPNLLEVEGVQISKDVSGKFSVPVIIENDANAAALGESISGAGKGFENFVLLTLGTGIGGGVIYRNQLLDIPAELGHITIKADADVCPCGNIGCLENYASGRAMISHAVSLLEKGSESLLKECSGGNFYKIGVEDIYRAALEGDMLSRDILRSAGRYLGVGISNIINLFSPEAIILTGGLLGAWNIYVQEAIREASRRSLSGLFQSVKIIPSSLKDDAGVIGAAGIVFSRIAGHELC